MTYSLYTSDPFTYPGGAIAAGVGVAVYFASTSVKAPIFYDDLGTTSKSNPVRTNDFGQVSFWIEPGSYDLVANGVRTNVAIAAIPAPPGPEDYVTRTEAQDMIDDAIAGGVAGVASVNGRTGVVTLTSSDVGFPTAVAKGDLYAATGAGAVARVAVGANGKVLAADSAASAGVSWVDQTGAAVTSVNGEVGAVVLDKVDIGLANVDNTSDAAKPISTATQTALDGKQALDADLTAIAALAPANDDVVQRKAGAWTNRTMAQVKTDLVLTKGDVGLSNVDNTSDVNKPISSATQTALDGKQALDSDLTTIAGLTATADNVIQSVAGAWASRTPAQVKSTLSLVKADVGLANVDNTSDANKPVSTATQTALDGKQAIDADLTTIAGLTATTDNFLQASASAWASRTPAQAKATLALVKGDVGLGNVDNTSDATKFANTALTGTTTAESATLSKRLLISPDTITIATGNADTDASLGNHFKISATANFTLTNPTNPSDGQRVMWQITQDATGGRTITLGSAFALGTDITAVVLSTAANKCDYLGAVYDSTAAKWRVVMFVKGY